MNLREMVLALFAVMMFTTIILVYNRSMWSQAELLDNGAKVIQATQLAHSRLDEIDAKLFSQLVAFNNVVNVFSGSQTVNLAYTGYTFSLDYDFKYCDSLGVNLGNQSYDDSPNFYKMTVTVSANGMPHPVSVTRLYNKTDLYN